MERLALAFPEDGNRDRLPYSRGIERVGVIVDVFDLLTGKLLGHFAASNGSDLVIDGLWGLTFEKDEVLDQESNFSAQRLYFTAGPNDEADGVLGILRPVSPSFAPAMKGHEALCRRADLDGGAVSRS